MRYMGTVTLDYYLGWSCLNEHINHDKSGSWEWSLSLWGFWPKYEFLNGDRGFRCAITTKKGFTDYVSIQVIKH